MLRNMHLSHIFLFFIQNFFDIVTFKKSKEVDEKIYGKMEKYVSFQNRRVHGQTLTAIKTYIKIRK